MPYPHKLDEERILDEAARLVDEQGMAALSTRTLAEHLHARAPSLYRYFPDKDGLLRALSARFLAELTRELAPHETLDGVARAYWRYATGHPRRYEVIAHHALEATGAARGGPPATVEPLLALAARLDPARPLPTARAIWSYLHGAASLCAAAPGRDGFGVEEAFELGLAALARGLTCRGRSGR